MNRRDHIKKLMALGAASAVPASLWASAAQTEGTVVKTERAFGYKRSVSHWTVTDLEWEELCPWLADQGIEAVDLVGPENWHHLKNTDWIVACATVRNLIWLTALFTRNLKGCCTSGTAR